MNDRGPIAWPATVARTIRTTAATNVPHPGPAPGSDAPALEVDAAVARFTAALEAVGGTVHALRDVDAVADLLRSLAPAPTAADVTTPSLLSWAPEHLPLPGVLDACRARGLDVLDARVDTDSEAHAADLARLDRAGVGLTGAEALLADTGSILVCSGPGRPRLASLLPPVHVALVTRAQLVPSLPVWAAGHASRPASVANLVVITGPSRTADIEMTLTRGVHGPKAVHVVFVA